MSNIDGKTVKNTSPKATKKKRRSPNAPVVPIENWNFAIEQKSYVLVRYRKAATGDDAKILIPKADFADPRLMTQTLLNVGADLPANRKEAQDLVAECLCEWPRKHVAILTKTGWHGDAFVIPGRKVENADGTNVRFAEGPHYSTLESDRIKKGSSKTYLKLMRPLAIQSDVLTFCLALGFSGATLALSPVPESAMFCLVGPTSTGKTTALRAAAGISESSAPGGQKPFDVTQRGIEEQAGQLRNDRLLALDELETFRGSETGISKTTLKHLVLILSGGQGRTVGKRAASSGLGQQNWRVLVLTTAEHSFRSMLQHGPNKLPQGTDVRLIEIPVPTVEKGGIFNRAQTKSAADLAEQVAGVLESQYGLVERRFVAFLERNQSEAKTLFSEAWDQFMADHTEGLCGHEHRIAKKFAHVFASGVLAIKAEAAPFAPEGLEVACKELLVSALAKSDSDQEQIAKLATTILETAKAKSSNSVWQKKRGNKTYICVAREEESWSIISKSDLQTLVEAAKRDGKLHLQKGRPDSKVSRGEHDRPRANIFCRDWLREIANQSN